MQPFHEHRLFDGHPRQANFGWFAMAELFCRKADWLNPPQVR
jgi:hypothetical protein